MSNFEYLNSRLFEGITWCQLVLIIKVAIYYILLHMVHVRSVDWDFFTGKLFNLLNFHLVLFSLLWPLDEIKLLHLFVHETFRLINFYHWRWPLKIFIQQKFPNLQYTTTIIRFFIVKIFSYAENAQKVFSWM